MLNSTSETNDLIVFSHLRWDFVFQRPQHLLTRHAKHRRVYYFEEPVYGMTDVPRLHLRETTEGVQVVVPYLPSSIKHEDIEPALKDIVDELIFEENLNHYSIWYYSPMALGFSSHLEPLHVIYDKIDEQTSLDSAPQILKDRELELFKKADLVFTNGNTLLESCKHLHQNIHPFPSSVDYNHFTQSRFNLNDPEDQAEIPHPRLGYYGVIDERFDLQLLGELATARPDFHFVIIASVAKIDLETLPQNTNIHYLGRKDYQMLPLYLSGWDCSIIPFVRSENSCILSTAKACEILASGIPVVTTNELDTDHFIGEQDLVQTALTRDSFIRSCELAMNEKSLHSDWLERADQFLKNNSWDSTFGRMAALETEMTKGRSYTRQMSENSLAVSGWQ